MPEVVKSIMGHYVGFASTGGTFLTTLIGQNEFIQQLCQLEAN